jgi:predicted metal-binding protein
MTTTPTFTTASQAPATLYVCETCRYDTSSRDHQGRDGGAIFLEHIRQRFEQTPLTDFRVVPTRCLMACTRHCTVHLRAPGKINYVIGDFEPTADNAAVVLDYAAKYQLSETGQVPYSTWPQGIKGHFIARTPALDDAG